MSAAPDAYEAIATLAERELELVRAGRLEDLAELQHRREALVAALPGAPPAQARDALARAARAQAAVTAALADGRERLAGELARLDRGRRGARGYAAPAARLAAFDRAG